VEHTTLADPLSLLFNIRRVVSDTHAHLLRDNLPNGHLALVSSLPVYFSLRARRTNHDSSLMSSEPKSQSPEAPGSPNSSQLASLPAAPSQLKKRFLDHLPPWVATNIRSKQSLRMLFRCWLASWAAFILLLPEKTLKTMGNAYVSCSFWGDA
jgi:hypothetical protein